MNKVSRLLAASACVFVSCVAFAKPPVKVEYLNSGKILPAGLPFSEAVRVGDTLYVSGQVGLQPGTLKLVPGGIKEETRQVMSNLKTTLEAHGYSLADLVKCTVMLADIGKWGDFNDIYKTYFTEHFPARSAMGVNGLAVGAQVELDCIAVAGAKAAKAEVK